MLRITPLYGSQYDKEGAVYGAECSLVEYGGVRVLWNVGYAHMQGSASAEAHRYWIREKTPLPEHDCLILTHSTLSSMGALPLYHRRYPDTPIYATFPTQKNGQMALYDLHAQVSLDGNDPHFTLQDIDDACQHIHAIKYAQQVVPIPGKIAITAHRAGHTVGGAFFILQRLQDETTVVLTSEYGIAREIHLDPATLVPNALAPDALVARPGGEALPWLHHPRIPHPKLLSQAQRNLTDAVMSVLRRDGNVLMPVDAAGRALEVVLLLHQHWERQRLASSYNLVWIGPMTQNLVEFVRAQLEWMRTSLGPDAWRLPHVHLCASVDDYLSSHSTVNHANPSCVVASGVSLEGGPARDLLLKWADNADNAILFSDTSGCALRQAVRDWPTPPQEMILVGEDASSMVVRNSVTWTAAGQLMKAYCQAQILDQEMEDSIHVTVPVPFRTPLEGAELQIFLREEEERRQAQVERQKQQAMLRQVEIAKGQLHLDEDAATAAASNQTTVKLASLPYARPRKKSRFDSSLFLKFSKPLHLTFDVREEIVGIGRSRLPARYVQGITDTKADTVMEDDYGIRFSADRFVDIVSGVDPSKFATGRIGDEVLRRGLGYGVDGVKKSSANKVSEDEESDGDELNEQAREAIDLSEGKGIIRARNGRDATKVQSTLRKIEVLAEVLWMPLEGRVDTRGARQTVRALQPQNMVVLGGPAKDEANDLIVDEVKALADAAVAFVPAGGKILAPSNGETVELDIGHAAFPIRIIDTPYLTAEEKSILVEPPKPIEPSEAKLGNCMVGLLDCIATGQKVAQDGSIVVAPRKDAANALPSIYVSDGEVLLTDLRTNLTGQGMKVDYSARQLTVNGRIIVKKNPENGRIEIEGPLCEDFYMVRAAVVGQYVVL